MPQAVKEIRRSDGAVSLFRYEAGRMVGGYGTDYGSFVIAAAPFSIEVTERTASLSGTSMRQTRYEDCLANPEGFITFMHFERREAHFAAGQWRTLRCHGHLSVSYDPQGRVASMRHAYQDGTGRSGKGRTTYEWEEDGKLSSVVLLSIPLFILAGKIMEHGRIGDALINFIEMFVGKIKGSLAIMTSVACAVFGSICGSGLATLSCIGSIMIPKMKQRRYPPEIAAAVSCCSAPLGMLIPPSGLCIVVA